MKFSENFISNYTNKEFLELEKALQIKYGENVKRTGESYYNLGASIYREYL